MSRLQPAHGLARPLARSPTGCAASAPRLDGTCLHLADRGWGGGSRGKKREGRGFTCPNGACLRAFLEPFAFFPRPSLCFPSAFSFLSSSIPWLIDRSIDSLIRSLLHSSFIHSLIHSFIHSFTNTPLSVPSLPPFSPLPRRSSPAASLEAAQSSRSPRGGEAPCRRTGPRAADSRCPREPASPSRSASPKPTPSPIRPGRGADRRGRRGSARPPAFAPRTGPARGKKRWRRARARRSAPSLPPSLPRDRAARRPGHGLGGSLTTSRLEAPCPE